MTGVAIRIEPLGKAKQILRTPAIGTGEPDLKSVLYRKEEVVDFAGLFDAKVTVTLFEDDTPFKRRRKAHYCMLVHKFDPKRITHWPVAVEPKLDGVRVLAHVDVTRGQVDFRSRNNNPFTSLNHLREPILRAIASAGHKRLILDGEIVGESFFETMGQIRQKQGPAKDVVFWIFDALTQPEYRGVNATPYQYRRAKMEEICAVNHPAFRAVPSQLCESMAEIEAAYATARHAGHEGVVVKDRRAAYERKRSHAFMKLKQKDTEDLRVVRAAEGKGKHEGRLGHLICRRGRIVVRIGTGFSDAQRAALWRMHRAGKLTGRIAEIGCHERTLNGSLRHPRFIRFRDNLVHGEKE